MVAPIYDLLPFPPPPSPPTGFAGWLRRRLSKKSLAEDAVTDPAPRLSRTTTELFEQRLSSSRSRSRSLSPHHPHPRPAQAADPMPRRTPAFITNQSHAQPAVVSMTSPTTSHSHTRHVNFPEPTTTAYFSPPSILSTTSSSSFLDSSLPDSLSIPSDAGVGGDSVSGGGGDGLVLRPQWSLSTADLHAAVAEQLPGTHSTPATHTTPAAAAATSRDSGFEVLLQYNVDGIQPFLVFLLGLPFVGVATQTGCVGAMSHGIKRAVGGVRIGGGGRVVKRVLPKEQPAEPVACEYAVQYTAYDEDREVEVEVEASGSGKRDNGKRVEYTAYDGADQEMEVKASGSGSGSGRRDKGKGRAY
ncbi:hypothetical protein BZA05DRAFT_434894 [Tricharina praecox]|uniref:uncharacterized protein n=1 Tax=Tricharina praecox TaxID=43433 RepID=UPI002220F1C5|nr:uncharacterized protein BZA05DRAFT_434894 [Tricharina praecox]KAI5854635.1 hypothetical protein BZA05DRAFT_434894 [Tricharina praecox]